MGQSLLNKLVMIVGCASIMCLFFFQAGSAKTSSPEVLKLTGTNVDLTYTTLAPGAQVFKLSIKEWTTDAEMQEMKAIIDKGGQRKLRNTLNKGEARGQINLASMDALDISIARNIPQKDGGCVILIVMMERVGLAFNKRDQEHIFGAAQIRLNAKGEGEGIVMGQVKLIIRDDLVMLFEKIGKDTNQLIGIKTVNK
jgi:hypothetical protein